MFLKKILLVLCFLTFSTVAFSQSIEITKFNNYIINPSQWTSTSPKVLDENSKLIPAGNFVQFEFKFTFVVANVPDNAPLLYGEWYDGNGTLYDIQYGVGTSGGTYPNGTYGWDAQTAKSTFNPFVVKPNSQFSITSQTPKFRLKLQYTSNSFNYYVYTTWHYFEVIPSPVPDAVTDFQFNPDLVTGSPLEFDPTSNLFNLDFSWTTIPNPVYGALNSTASIENYYLIKKNSSNNVQTSTNIGNAIATFNDSPSNTTQRFVFEVQTWDNVPNSSDFSNKCFAYDSFKKGPNPADPTPTFPYNQIDIGKNAIFNGWFNITNAFGLNVKKLFFEEYTKLFVSGTFALAFEDLVCGVGSELIVDGGTLYLNSGSISTQNYGCSDLTNPYAISCFAVKSGTLNLDADINFENGSFLLVNDNLNISQNRTIRIKTGSKLVVGENANFTYGTSSSIILEDGAVLEIDGVVNVTSFESPNLVMENGSKIKNN